MVKIRLTKLGRHKLPAYRIIAIDQRKRRDGKYLELLGTYEPASGKVAINEEATLKLLANGAQPVETVLSILKKQGIWAKFLANKKAKKAEKPAVEKPVKKTAKRKLSAKKVAGKAAKKAAPKKAKTAPAKVEEAKKEEAK